MKAAPVAFLLEHRDEALGVIYGSTLAEPLRIALGAFLGAKLDVAAARQQSALERSQERSGGIREAIRAEVDRFAIERPRLKTRELSVLVRRALACRLTQYGLRSAPSRRTIRDEVARYKNVPFDTGTASGHLSNAGRTQPTDKDSPDA